MATAGYSNTPLAKKLGIKDGFIIKLVNAPVNYWQLFSDLPEKLYFNDDPSVKKNFIHLFITSANELYKLLPGLKQEMLNDGMIWVSWHKKSSGIKSDVKEDTIRQLALEIGLVDIKVCAVDEQWSGLKLVIPVKKR